MRVLLSPGESDLARTLRNGLTGHDAVLDVDPEIDAESGARTLAAGVDAVVLAGLPDGDADGATDASAVLDRATRLAYDLLCAAADSGARRCVYLSSLRLLADYPAHHTVTEGWRPLPPSDDPALLGCHLGEQIACEFARERRMEVVTVRLGYPVVPGSAAPSPTRTATLPSAPTTWWPWCPPRSRRRSVRHARSCTPSRPSRTPGT